MGLAKRIATARIWNPDLAGRDRDTVALRRMWQVLNPRAVPPDVPLSVDRINELLTEAADTTYSG